MHNVRDKEAFVHADAEQALVAMWEFPWIVGVRLSDAGEATLVHDVLIRSIAEGGYGESADDWQGPSLAGILAQAAAILRAQREGEQKRLTHLNEHEQRTAELFNAWKVKARKRGPAEYAALAARYVQEIDKGNTAPVETLANELGLSPVTVAQRIREARSKKLLTDPAVGSTGGRLTPLALAHVRPGFVGVATLRLQGKSFAEITMEYGITEEQAIQALADAGALDLAVNRPE